jgi:hypothetical protein
VGAPVVSDVEKMVPANDLVALLRDTVEQITAKTEQVVAELTTKLPDALAGPRVSPVLNFRLARLRSSVTAWRAAGQAMLAAAERANDEQSMSAEAFPSTPADGTVTS